MSTRTALQVILTREFAGTERHVAELAASMRARGWRSLIAVRGDASQRVLQEYATAAEVIPLPGGPAPALAPRIAIVIRRERVDVVHGHLGNGTAAAVGAALLTGSAVVSTAHFIAPRHVTSRAARLKRPLHRAMLRRADAVIAVSDVVRRSLHDMSRAAAAPVHLVRHGIADIAPGASPRRERDGATPVILFAGRLSAEKRPALLVDAVARMHTCADVWIAGEGAQRRAVEEAARRLGPGRVRLLGGVGDVDRVMRDADVLAIPSQVEGFGLVALEAMRAGLPVVCFATGALPEIVVDGTTGLLVARDDIDAFARALDVVLSDRARALRLGMAGRARFEQRFSAARMAAETEAVYMTVLQRRSPAAVSA